MWFVYVLISEKSGKRYVGISQNVARRLIEHNAGKSKFTSGHVPWRLLYTESFDSAQLAREKEKYFKTASGRRFLDRRMNTGSLPD